MSADLAALAPSAIVCVAFLVGGWLLLRRELAPKRRARGSTDAPSGDGSADTHSQGKSLYFTASRDYVVPSIGFRDATVAEIRSAEFVHSLAVPAGRYANCVPLA